MTASRFIPVMEKFGKLPTALIVGGAGFLGSHLCEKLLFLKMKVICLDNIVTGKKENLRNCVANPNFSFIEKDITEPIKEIGEKVDYIFHLASIEEYLNKEELNLKNLLTNSQGTKNLLDLAVKNKAKFLLGSILDVFLGNLSEKSLEDNFSGFYTHNEAKRYSEAITTEYFKKFHLDSRIVRVRDVFGPRMDLYSGGNLAEIFRALISDKELKIPGDGLKNIYPTYVLDLVEGLIRTMFKLETAGKVFNLIGQKISLINFSSLLKKNNPDLKIIYVKGKENLEIPVNEEALIKTAKEIGWQTRSLEEGMKETENYYKESVKTKKTEPLVKKEDKTTNRPAEISLPSKKAKHKLAIKFPKISFSWKTSLLFLSLILIFMMVFYPPLAAFYRGYQGFKKVKEIKEKKIINNLDQTINVALSASKDFTGSYQKVDSLTWLITIIKKRPTQEKYLKILTAGQNSAEAIYHALLAGKNLNSLLGAMTEDFSDDSLVKISEAKLELDQSQENFSFTLAILKELREKKMEKLFFGKKSFNLSLYEKEIENIITNLKEINGLLVEAPAVLGKDARKTYLILLQNNMELRPTGGFIGSYGLVILEKGKLVDFKIEDIYTADGQLKGKVKPPDEILHYLGQPNWYLRDSNFSPDFPLSAKRAEWFLEKEMGILVDGVIGVDLSLVQKLVKAVGSIDIPDYKEKITAENLFEKAETRVERNFFPGSTQKKNFLSSLGKTLFDRVMHVDPQDYFNITTAITESLKERHLAFYFNEERVQKFFRLQNANGEIIQETNEPSLGQVNDYLMIVDSNLGANKTNYFLERKIRQSVTVNKLNGITEKVEVYFKNNSPMNDWPGGRYKTYLRIYVPQEAVFSGADINENKKPKLITALTEEELKKLKPDNFLVIEATEAGRKSWGTLVEIPIGTSKEVTFSYRLPGRMNFTKDGESNYSLYVQKQAGTVKDNYDLTISFPDLELLEKDKAGIEKGEDVAYNTNLLTDREFKIKLKSSLP